MLFALGIPATAQLVEFPLPSYRASSRSNKAASRTQAVADPTFLPFWDDFSASDTLLQDSLWLYGQSVTLNNGLGIRPPSKNVVSFDGADSLGKPYNINDVLAKGFADRLTSQPIRMDLVAPGDRPSVYFSFFYQLQGRGEPPDPGDQLLVAFRAQDGTWETVFTIETGPTLATDEFVQVILPVTEARYFYDAFQFRIFNYARLSGPYDTWNVDYLFLNKGRSATDNRFPDRTVSRSFSSLFSDFYAMPVRHFLEDVNANLAHPTTELYNLLEFDYGTTSPHSQPILYTTSATISWRIDGTDSTEVIGLDTSQSPGADLDGLTFLPVTLNTVPSASDFNLNSDSIHIRLSFGFTSKDNVLPGPPDDGDYDPVKYSPIEFRYNDSLRADYVLSSYYAYDDGVAEYAAGLNQAGSFLAFLFETKTQNSDTLTYVDIYFPEFGDNTNQSLLLQLRTALDDIDTPPLFEQLIVVNRTTKNKFTRYALTRPVHVGSTYYVGWKQISNASIPVGLDKNNDNGDKIYYSVNGTWVQNTLVHGSIMVRPGYGKGDGVVTSLEAPISPVLYPNPTHGECRMRGRPDHIEAFDISGRSLALDVVPLGDETQLLFPSSTQGLVLVRMLVNGKAYTQKIIVRGAGR